MHVVDQIFAAFGDSPKRLADATGIPVQTVWDWRGKGRKEIPVWRRSAVLQAVRGMELGPEVLSYLNSTERSAA